MTSPSRLLLLVVLLAFVLCLWLPVGKAQMNGALDPIMGDFSTRRFKPPFPATTVEVTPKFKVVSERGPFAISTGVSFPIEFELSSEPEAVRELDEPPEMNMGKQSMFANFLRMDHQRMGSKHFPVTKTAAKSKTSGSTVPAKSSQGKGDTANQLSTAGSASFSRRNRALKVAPRAVQERLQLFKGITMSMSRVGLAGEQCLLRAICEAAKFPQSVDEGLAGQIVTLLLTIPENNAQEMRNYNSAAELGRMRNCTTYNDCPVSVFDVVTLS